MELAAALAEVAEARGLDVEQLALVADGIRQNVEATAELADGTENLSGKLTAM
jgi:hypothetical protein